MVDTTDPIELAVRTLVLVVVAGVFFFVLRSKKEDKK
jgi:hypothetical protein